LQLFEDDYGLRVQITPASTSAMADLVALIARGDVNQMSFAFSIPPGGDDWEETASGEIIRTLLKVQLYEVSPVTFPAYPSTEISARSAELGKRVMPPKQFRTAVRARARERQLQLIEKEL
jgi:HK97 family phage prohead protease